MGLLIDGQWHDQWYDTKKSGGKFERESARFRNWVTATGDAGPGGEAGFAAEPDRYHLYVAQACPWAHRTLIMRRLKRLDSIISVSVVHPDMGEHGWTFERGVRGSDQEGSGDDLFGLQYLHQLYTRAAADYTGRVTVPVLWDKQRETIVSNESADIIRMFNSAFNHLTGEQTDYYPEHLRRSIDAWNELIYHNVNNGVYRAGFATTQQAYQEAVEPLFATLEDIDRHLAEHTYLVGEQITEADWRLFTTLIRFDHVYVGHFKCNIRMLKDFHHLHSYVRELYQQPGVSDTINMDSIKRHYYVSHDTINPTGVVPLGPDIDFNRPGDRSHKMTLQVA